MTLGVLPYPRHLRWLGYDKTPSIYNTYYEIIIGSISQQT